MLNQKFTTFNSRTNHNQDVMINTINRNLISKIALIILIFPISLIYSRAERSPCLRNQPVTAYHIKENKIFLFGGYCSTEKKRLNDLWAFDGMRWESINVKTAPEPRSGHSMIYDSFGERLLVFGGKNEKGELLNDLWSWNGTNWLLLNNSGPPPRQSHRMIFNNDNGDIFLFGGSNAAKQSLNDTWVFNHGKWTKLNRQNSPPPRLQHTLIYDQLRKKIVLFGGFDKTEEKKIIYGDTWEWSSAQGWKLKDKNEKIARDHHAMVYDPESKTTILFGGYNQGYLGDTWSWNGKKWILRAVNGPSRAGKPGLMYNNFEKCVVLFGGGNKQNMYLMDFWQFSGTTNLWSMYPKK